MCLYWGALLEPGCTCGRRERGSTWSGPSTGSGARCSVEIGELGSDPDTEKTIRIVVSQIEELGSTLCILFE
jgi:hypothetical protein